ncbi:YerC/YecD family TrpR-related protein [Halalkalibacter flavus]|uniref:YerC/YecD family TrpR-related protein n=1 Tax=Halalkalibacter flavus TaxID=3090668 RepID=UPI002FC6AC97
MKIDKEKANREQFFKALLSLNTVEECVDFFDDLATVRELEAFMQRFQVAERLLNGETYEEIELETNARSSMVSRVKRCLEKEQSGLKKILERLAEARNMEKP